MMYKHVLGLLYLFTTRALSDINIALNKPTKLSSIYDPYIHEGYQYDCCDSNYAVDGDLREWMGDNFLCTHTDIIKVKQEWWSVDLQNVYTVEYLDIYGRTDCCIDFLANFDVEVILPGTCNRWNNLAVGSIFHCHYQSSGVQQITITCPPNTRGRFLRIKRRDFDPLVICEVQIYGNIFNVTMESGLESSIDRTVTAYACGHIGYKNLGTVIDTSVAQSDIQCTTMCITKPACTAAEYDKKTHVCTLKGESMNGTQSTLLLDSDKNIFFIQ